MKIPHVPRNDVVKIGTDPVAVDFSGNTAASTPSTKTLIIVSAVLGSLILTVAAVTIYLVITRARRKKQLAHEYNTAILRNPNLTWEEYARRTKLSHSRILLEEELQRSIMIRKSLQSRTDVSTVTPVSPPARTRSRTWHARTSSRTSVEDEEEGEGLLMSLRGDWTEHEARVEKTWQILHKKYPTRRVTLPVEEDAGPVRPPTIRLKTPPLLSHPMFRGWNGETEMKHSSLPTELAKIKPAQI
ncbi:hypothetical protein CGCSCA5_v006923 [Colletotrichum siamense]|uniref:Uncharacterized protein n=1 Tax=Colletotrichum noveboracense TaxID=2664923 RepID=A0A9W4RJN4_9PEZI|nr:hypothetical protein CGCSCA5_v006923 [Colletotrichum siamense]KAF4864899.1 hypothetical protein CGCSCA1_v014213 [Colletotrichum siamense]KAH9231876.1 hypothetical protein K456DRAFT_1896026 [Colletotrichum gloeosporioides 23]KAJ0305659.1 hypothetical protein Brms1b_010772 [Colletotrichum noveboracense]CAI0641929.1 unnamed protein product [Colletotrichum noveboracense]